MPVTPSQVRSVFAHGRGLTRRCRPNRYICRPGRNVRSLTSSSGTLRSMNACCRASTSSSSARRPPGNDRSVANALLPSTNTRTFSPKWKSPWSMMRLSRKTSSPCALGRKLKFHHASRRSCRLPPKLAQILPSSDSGTYLMASQKSVRWSLGTSARPDQSSFWRRNWNFGGFQVRSTEGSVSLCPHAVLHHAPRSTITMANVLTPIAAATMYLSAKPPGGNPPPYPGSEAMRCAPSVSCRRRHCACQSAVS